MADPLVVIGAGGFAREALDVFMAVNDDRFDLVGVMDDSPSDQNLDRLRARGIAYLGAATPEALPLARTSVILAVGSPASRLALWDRFADSQARMATLVHPSVEVGSQTRIGPGSILCPGVVVGTNVTIGIAAHLNPHVTIGHDTTLCNYVSINPAATISGDCVIEDRVLMGAASVVLQGLTVSAAAVVGAGAVVVRDVPADQTVRGVPAR